MTEPKVNLLLPEDIGERSITVGRYVLHRQIARGGMATIHIARLMGHEGFSRIVAVKRLHPEFAEDAEFVAMFLDEARIASKVHHRNVVPVLDVVNAGEEVILVQEYVHGVPLGWLLKNSPETRGSIPVNIAVSVVCQVLAGLQATHETADELGQPMHIVHRDVSPQNVMVATDGSARLLDFGVAKAVMAAHVTRDGTYKGKLAYSAPEQLRGAATPQSDVYSLSVMFWELLVGERMHRTKNGVELVQAVVNGTPPTLREALSAEGRWEQLSPADRRQLLVLDPIVRKGLEVDTRERWASAADMERAILDVARPATTGEVAAWLKVSGKKFLDRRDAVIAAEEASWRRAQPTTLVRSSSAPAALESYIHLRGNKGQHADNEQQRSYATPKVAVVCLLSVLLAVVGWTLWPGFSRPASTLTERPTPTSAPLPPQAQRSQGISAPSAPSPVPAAVAQSPDEQPPAAVDAANGPADGPVTELARARPAPSEPTKPAPSEPRDRAHRPKDVRPRASAHDAVSASPTPAAAQPAAENDGCATPYYFEGSKKVFKPECL